MNSHYEGIRLFRKDDPILELLRKIDPVIQPVIPLYLYIYMSEVCATVKAFARTFKEKTCSKNYCKDSKRTIQVIKLLWLVFLPVVIAAAPRRICLPQVIILVVVSSLMYVGALKNAASCITALMLTTVSTITIDV